MEPREGAAMSDIRYSKEHEWVRVDGQVATVGISDHAQQQLGDVVFVELPEVGREVAQNAAMAVVESVKAASDVYAPISGKVVEVNGALSDDPALVNGDAEGAGWFCKLEITKPDELEGLMDAGAYRTFAETQS
jgi:glycine cleavage system H protein